MELTLYPYTLLYVSKHMLSILTKKVSYYWQCYQSYLEKTDVVMEPVLSGT